MPTAKYFHTKKIQLIKNIRRYILMKFELQLIMFVKKLNKKPKKLFFAFFSENFEVRLKMNDTKVEDIFLFYNFYFQFFSIGSAF